MRPMKSGCYVIHDASSLLDVASSMRCGNYPRAFCAKETEQLTPCGSVSTVCTASLRKSAEPASWPRRAPALGQRCTRAGERSAGLFVCVTRTTRTCPNIRDLILKCTKTHESAQLGLWTQICVIILAILGFGTRFEDAGGPGENRNQTIKCRTKIKESNTTCNTTIPYHPKKESKQSKYR